MEPFRRINPQDLLFAQQIRDVNRRLDAVEFPFGDKEEFILSPTTPQNIQDRNLFRIIAADGNGRYSAVPVFHVVADLPVSANGPPRSADTFVDDLSGLNGPVLDMNHYPLTEINGVANVAIGQVVNAFLSKTNSAWEFASQLVSNDYPYPYGYYDGNGNGSSIKHRALLNVGCGTSGHIVGDLVEYTVVGLMRNGRLFLSISLEVIEEDKILVSTACKEFLTKDSTVTCVDGVITFTKVTEWVRGVVCGACP